jgi:hypothetical protein
MILKRLLEWLPKRLLLKRLLKRLLIRLLKIHQISKMRQQIKESKSKKLMVCNKCLILQRKQRSQLRTRMRRSQNRPRRTRKAHGSLTRISIRNKTIFCSATTQYDRVKTRTKSPISKKISNPNNKMPASRKPVLRGVRYLSIFRTLIKSASSPSSTSRC